MNDGCTQNRFMGKNEETISSGLTDCASRGEERDIVEITNPFRLFAKAFSCSSSLDFDSFSAISTFRKYRQI
jgi:hypothetical protein